METLKIFLSPIVVYLVSAGLFWKLFIKAGRSGALALVPVYNLFVALKLAGCPGWWVILMFIPYLDFIFMAIWTFKLAKSFGKGDDYALLCVFFGFVLIPVLAFGDAVYTGPSGRAQQGAQPDAGTSARAG